LLKEGKGTHSSTVVAKFPTYNRLSDSALAELDEAILLVQE